MAESLSGPAFAIEDVHGHSQRLMQLDRSSAKTLSSTSKAATAPFAKFKVKLTANPTGEVPPGFPPKGLAWIAHPIDDEMRLAPDTKSGEF
jgi:hypothetical protein